LLNEEDVGLVEGLTLDMAKLSVAGLHYQRLELVAVALSNQGVPATPEFVRELGEYWGTAFQAYSNRSCFLCGGGAKKNGLCGCYPTVQVPTTREEVASIAAAYPQGWRRILTERCECGCGAVFDVPLGVIADRLQQGRLWSTPKACRDCWNAAKRPRPKWAEPQEARTASSSLDLLLREIETRLTNRKEA